jgi:hypothetical protein
MLNHLHPISQTNVKSNNNSYDLNPYYMLGTLLTFSYLILNKFLEVYK